MKMMGSPKVKAIIKDLSLQYMIPVADMVDIVSSPFTFTARVIAGSDRETLDFRHVRVPWFGVFYVRPKRKEALRRVNEKRRVNNEQSKQGK